MIAASRWPACLMLLVACSSKSSETEDGYDGPVLAYTVAGKIDMDCADSFKADTQNEFELLIADSGTCRLNGRKLDIYLFADNESRDEWILRASQFGLGRYVVINRGVVLSDSPGSAEFVKSKIGGEIRTGP